jgi:hypothetical protein
LTADEVIALGERAVDVQQNEATFDVTLDTEVIQENLTSAEVNELGEQAVNVQQNEPTFDVTLRPGITEAGERLALQLITTLGTLVAAISAFYFGYRAAEVPEQTGISALTIANIEPPKSLNIKVVEVTITGTGFVDATQVKLRLDGQSDIGGIRTKLEPTILTCTFDLRDKVTGKWDVVVINPDGSTVVKK